MNIQISPGKRLCNISFVRSARCFQLLFKGAAQSLGCSNGRRTIRFVTFDSGDTVSEAKQGNPDACASSKAILSPSYKDGIANTSMAAYSRRVSGGNPKNGHYLVFLNLRPGCRSICSKGPSPISSSCAAGTARWHIENAFSKKRWFFTSTMRPTWPITGVSGAIPNWLRHKRRAVLSKENAWVSIALGRIYTDDGMPIKAVSAA